MSFERVKTFFFKKKTFQIISNFSKFEKFLHFCKKTSQLRWKRYFTKYYHLIRILQQSCLFYRFQKKSVFLSKKTLIAYVFEKFFYFSRILRQTCYNLVTKISNSESFGPEILPGQSASTRKEANGAEWMISLPYYKYGLKILRRSGITIFCIINWVKN